MICPKCGRNIEGGGVCPYCDAPQIDDNTEEYLKRKNAYEESLSEKEEEKGENPSPVKKPKRRHAIAAIIVIGAALTAAIVTTHLPKIYDGRLFAEKNGVVSEITSDGTLKERAGRIYSSEGKSVYAEVNAPSGLPGEEGGGIRDFHASSNGEYFSMVYYGSGEEDKDYTLCVWDKNGNTAVVLKQEEALAVRDITDGGEVIFTKTNVLNDQWFMGDTSLHVFKVTGSSGGELSGVTKRISDSIQSFYIYENAGSIICLDKDGKLYSCSNFDPENRYDIADGVTALLAERGEEDNMFSSDAPYVNVSTSADLIAFNRDGIWTLTDTRGRISLNLGVAGEDASFVYSDSDRLVYRLEKETLSRSVLRDEGLTEWEKTGEATGNIIWDIGKSRLLFTEADGSLKSAGASGITTLAKNCVPSTLLRIKNSGSYALQGADGLLIGDDGSSSPVPVSGDLEAQIEEAAAYKGRIYVNAGGSLFAIDKNKSMAQADECDALYVIE